MYQTIVEAVLAHARQMPDKLAVGFKKNRITYGQLAVQMKSMAMVLKECCSVQKGDFVMLSGVSKPDYIVGYLAVQYLGAVSVPIEKTAKTENILDVYEYTQPRVVLADGKILSEEIRACSLKELYTEALERSGEQEEIAPAARTDSEVAEILFTTGTTGKPKGTMLTVGNIYAITHNNRDGVGIQPSDCELIPLPLNHSLGLRVLRTLLYVGATVVLQNGFTFAQEIEKNINDFGCTGMVIVPASMEVIYRQMQDKFPEIMGKLRYMEVGAGSLGYDMKKKLTKVLPDTHIVNTWGSTETGGVIFLEVSKYPDKFTALGKPISSAELKVVDEEGKEIRATDIDTAGRMILQGPMQMAGYFNMPEATSQTLVDGWLYTNDIVYTDEDGFVYMMGRADDIINVGGEKVSPIEVENIAQEYEGVVECACIGVDDPEGILGRVPVLFVVPESSGYNEEEFSKFLAGRMERYKLPQQYVIISELPRNRMKKLDRKALYKLWETGTDEKLMNEAVRNILTRRSVREFKEQEIPKEYLDMILQCGYYAPSGHNMQTWRFTVVRGKEQIDRFKEVAARVAGEKKAHFYGLNQPDTLILVSNDRRNADGVQDSSCAAQNMMLAANSYGIGSVWINVLMTISDEPEVRELLRGYGIPDSHIVWSTIAMGYPAGEGKLLAKKTDVIGWVK